MTHIFVDVPPSARVRFPSGSDPVGPKSLNRQALRAGTAMASAIRGALAFAPAQAFVAPPVDGLPPFAQPDIEGPPSLAVRFGRFLRRRPGHDRSMRWSDPLWRSVPGKSLRTMV